MKRTGSLLPKIAEMDNLRLAFWKASKGKRYSAQVLEFQEKLEENLSELSHQIESGLVEVGKYRYFKIWEPKERQICAAAFSEQVLHHALMNHCHELFERHLVFDSYASRRGKGVHAALARAKYFTQSYAWFLKLDVKKFFDSVPHKVLKVQLAGLFREPGLLDIFVKIIDSYEASPGRGLPIGNLTSQYFANHFLSGLDHYIREELKIGASVRYMDDIALWDNDKNCLKRAHQAIREFVETRLHCALKPETLGACGRGLTFLGYRIYPGRIELSQTSKRRFIRKWHTLEEKYDSGEWTEATCQRHALPLFAFIRHADTQKFREKVLLPQWSSAERVPTA